MDKMVEISQYEYNRLTAMWNTALNYIGNHARRCPKCGKAYIVNGNACSYCGFDDSEHDDNENDELEEYLGYYSK